MPTLAVGMFCNVPKHAHASVGMAPCRQRSVRRPGGRASIGVNPNCQRSSPGWCLESESGFPRTRCHHRPGQISCVACVKRTNGICNPRPRADNAGETSSPSFRTSALGVDGRFPDNTMLFNRRSPRPTHFRPISLRRSGVGMGTVSNQERQTPGDQGRRRRWAGPLWIPGPARPSSCWYQLTITNLTYARCHYKAISETILTLLEGLTSPMFAHYPILTLSGLCGMWWGR